MSPKLKAATDCFVKVHINHFPKEHPGKNCIEPELNNNIKHILLFDAVKRI